jgi:hypothetical protein
MSPGLAGCRVRADLGRRTARQRCLVTQAFGAVRNPRFENQDMSKTEQRRRAGCDWL